MDYCKKRRVYLEHSLQKENDGEGALDALVFHVFSVDLVLKEILKNLTVKDLLKFSLVSKQWNVTARSVLRESKKCLAYARRNNWCQDLRSIDIIMSQSVNLPINGLSLSIKGSDHDCIAYSNLTEAFPFLLNPMVRLKYLELNWVDEMDCPGVEFVREIFKTRSAHLKSLEIFKIPNFHSVREIFEIQTARRHHWLPNVTTLELPYSIGACTHLMDEFLEGCPRLQNIFGSIGLKALDVVLRRNKAHTIKDFDFCPADANQIKYCAQFAQTQPRLRRLNISAYLDDNLPVYSQILRMILESSSSSLEELDISHWNLFLLNKLEIPPLTKLRMIRLGYCQQIDAQQGFPTLTKVNWGRLFPSVGVLEIFDEDLRPQGISKPYLDDHFYSQPPSQFLSVRKFVVLADSYNFPQPIFSYFSQLLPNVNNIHIFSCPSMSDYLPLLWTTWPAMEFITFYNTNDTDLNSNLDAVFCGIEEDMAEELRKFNPKALELIQLKPTKPSMFDLKDLKRFRLDILHRKICDNTDKNNFILSNITGALVFSAIPGLEVEIARRDCHSSWNVPCRFKLDNLARFAKFYYASGWCPFEAAGRL